MMMIYSLGWPEVTVNPPKIIGIVDNVGRCEAKIKQIYLLHTKSCDDNDDGDDDGGDEDLLLMANEQCLLLDDCAGIWLAAATDRLALCLTVSSNN